MSGIVVAPVTKGNTAQLHAVYAHNKSIPCIDGLNSTDDPMIQGWEVSASF